MRRARTERLTRSRSLSGFRTVAGNARALLVAQETLSGLLLGAVYLGCGRNLAMPIIAHGVSNTLALVLIYVNRYPGV